MAKKAAAAAGSRSLGDKLREYFAGEGKSLHDGITLDDVIHAEKFNGAAPEAKKPKAPKSSDTE